MHASCALPRNRASGPGLSCPATLDATGHIDPCGRTSELPRRHFRRQSAGENQRQFREPFIVLGKQLPIDSSTRAAIMSGGGGIDKHASGTEPDASRHDSYPRRWLPSIAASNRRARMISKSRMELRQNGAAVRLRATGSASMPHRVDDSQIRLQTWFTNTPTRSVRAASAATIRCGFGEFNTPRASAKEIESDGIRAGVDCRERIVDVRNTTNLNAESCIHHTDALRSAGLA